MDSCIEKITYSEKLSPSTAHRHNVYQVIYITEGCAQFSVLDKSYLANAPAVIFISHLEEHHFKVKSDTYKRFALYINPEKAKTAIHDSHLSSIFTNRPESFEHCILLGNLEASVSAIFRLLYNEHTSTFSGESISNMLLKSLLILLSRNFKEHFTEATSSIENIVTSVKYTLEKTPFKSFPLEELAKKHNISVYYLAHSFKQTTGYSIKQYHILCRISQAKEMLACTNLSISEICYTVGFNDLSNFSRIFSRITGLTPSDYREKTKRTE